jgi:hypothetical protein
MAKKKITLATIAAQIQKIDTRMERGFAAIADDIGEMRAAMVTKVTTMPSDRRQRTTSTGSA